jgi:hypothetical protein
MSKENNLDNFMYGNSPCDLTYQSHFISDLKHPKESQCTFGAFNYMSKVAKPAGHNFFDISCFHGRYSKKAMIENLWLKAIYISLLRDPVQQFISNWNFYSLSRHFSGISIDNWLLGSVWLSKMVETVC